eukprot:TRINITY_DN8387_c0_g1_i1.p1 TRINITY_DN8387_c0_g1~~TRINITY_DN8387_c0_g1_i1.p1  ORF type:complete len:264 (+),score=44.02 TRINITY_DN8387_c0_g1_i1:62-853(+)
MESIARDIGFASMSCVIGYIISWFLVPSSSKDRVNSCDILFSAPYYPILSYLAFHATLSMSSSTEDRFHGNVWSSYWCMILYSAGNLVHIPITFMKKQKTDYKIMMFFHHVFTIACYVVGLHYKRIWFYGSLAACCELSTMFLNNVFLFKELNVNRSIQTINGVLLWLSYLILRIVLFPFWAYLFIGDILASPSTTWDTLTTIERVFFVPTPVLLFLLSCNWFVGITKGMIKAVKGEKVKTQLKEDEEPEDGGKPLTEQKKDQ